MVVERPLIGITAPWVRAETAHGLAARRDAGLELVVVSDHVSFRGGTGQDGLLRAAGIHALEPDLAVLVDPSSNSIWVGSVPTVETDPAQKHYLGSLRRAPVSDMRRICTRRLPRDRSRPLTSATARWSVRRLSGVQRAAAA